MHHNKILVAGSVADGLEQIHNRFVLPRGGMYENRTVMIPLGDLDVQVGIILYMQHLLMTAHLIPLIVLPLGGVNAPERLHCQKKLQLEMRDTPRNRLAAKRADKMFPFGHYPASFLLIFLFIVGGGFLCVNGHSCAILRHSCHSLPRQPYSAPFPDTLIDWLWENLIPYSIEKES